MGKKTMLCLLRTSKKIMKMQLWSHKFEIQQNNI